MSLAPACDSTDGLWLDTHSSLPVALSAIAPLSYDPSTHFLAISNASGTTGGSITTGAQTIAGQKTFTSAPISVAPTASLELATKKYVDDLVDYGQTWQDAIEKFYDFTAGDPAGLAVGKRYIATVTVGSYTAKYIYTCLSTTPSVTYQETIPSEGWCLNNKDDNLCYIFSHAGDWSRMGISMDHTDLINKGTLTHAQIDGYLDQSVKTTAAPSFAGVTSTKTASIASKATIGSDLSSLILAANYAYSTNANYMAGGGKLTPEGVFGGATITNGKLDVICVAAPYRYVQYNLTGANTNLTQLMTIEFLVTPQYSGTPASNQQFFRLTDNSTNVNIIYFIHAATTGKMSLNLADQAGTYLTTASSTSAWVPVSGTEYLMTLVIDCNNASATKLYIDGVLFHTWNTQGTRSNVIPYCTVGYHGNVSTYYIRQFAIHNVLRVTGAFTPSERTIFGSQTYGIAQADAVNCSGQLMLSNTSQAISSSSGSLVSLGGAAIGKNAVIGGDITFRGDHFSAPSNLVFAASLASTADASFCSVNPTATLGGGAAINNRKLDLTNGTKYCYYAADNLLNVTTALTIRCYLTWAGNTSGFQYILWLGSSNNAVVPYYDTSIGTFGCYLRDSANTLNSIVFTSGFQWVAGVEYEILVTLDTVAGNCYGFINGTKQPLGMTGAPYTRTGSVNLFRIGNTSSGPADFSLRGLTVWNTVLYSANYTSGAFDTSPRFIAPTYGLRNLEDVSTTTGPIISGTHMACAGNQFYVPSNCIFAAPYSLSINPAWTATGPNVKGTAVNGATITGRRLDLSGGAAKKYVYYPTEVMTLTNTGTFRFYVTFMALPPTRQYVIYSYTSTTAYNDIFLSWLTSDASWHLTIRDSAGVAIVNDAAIHAMTPVLGREYEVTMCFNTTSGVHDCFVDGVKGTTLSGTGTRGSSLSYFYVGDPITNTAMYLRGLSIYNTALHTASYTTSGYSMSTDLVSPNWRIKNLDGLTVSDTTESSSVSTGSMTTLGGIGCAKRVTATNMSCVSAPSASTDVVRLSDLGFTGYDAHLNACEYIASFSQAISAEYGASTTITGVGSPAISSGRLDLSAGAVKYVYLDAATCLPGLRYRATIRFKYRPHYSVPSSATYILSTGATTTHNNGLDLWQDDSGQLWLDIYNSAGTRSLQVQVAWTPTLDQEYEFEINFDSNNGSSGSVARVFIDGVKTEATGTNFTRTATFTNLYIGTTNVDPSSYYSYFWIRDLSVIGNLTYAHTSNYTSGSYSTLVETRGRYVAPRITCSLAPEVSTDVARLTDLESSASDIDGGVWSQPGTSTYSPLTQVSSYINKVRSLVCFRWTQGNTYTLAGNDVVQLNVHESTSALGLITSTYRPTRQQNFVIFGAIGSTYQGLRMVITTGGVVQITKLDGGAFSSASAITIIDGSVTWSV